MSYLMQLRETGNRLGQLIISVLVVLLVYQGANAQTPSWQTAVATSGYFSHVNATASDAFGNVYLAGEFYGTANFGNTTLTSVGGSDAFVAKWDNSSKSFVWVKQAGGLLEDKAYAIAVSGVNIYVAGNFSSNTISFDNSVITSAGDYDAFVAKLVDAGSTSIFAWAQQAGGIGVDEALAIAVNGSNIYVAGGFAGNLGTGFTANFGSISLTGGNLHLNFFIAKITDSGTTSSFVWAQHFYSDASTNKAISLAVNGVNLYIASSFNGTITIGSTVLNAVYGDEAFVAKLIDAGSSSNFIWAQQTNNSGLNNSHAAAYALAVAGSNVYVAGDLGGTVNFGNVSLTSLSSGNAFVAKLNDAGGNGSFVWAQRAGGTIGSSRSYDYANALAADGSNVYLAGIFESSTATFGSIVLTNTGFDNFFIAKLIDTGNTSSFIWAQQPVGPSVWVESVTVSGANVYVGGFFQSNGASFGSTVLANSAPNSVVAGFLASLNESPLLTAYHLPQPGSPTSRTDLNFQTTGVVKIGADNTAATLFSVARSSQPLTLRLQENPTNTSTGTLADAAGYLIPQAPTATAVEAIYHHPAFVDATGSHKDLHLELVDNTGTVLGTYPIQAVRPPLLLVHGLWSNGQDAYPGLPAKLVADGLYDREGDIHYAHYDNDREFSHNAPFIINCKNALLQSYADRNVSVSKIDVIGHSMGGLLTRQYIQSSAYQQDINKLITLNTPHSGSPIPNFINALPTIPREALVTGLIHVGMNPLKGAVDDLNYSSPSAGIARLNAAPNTHGVAVHALTTTFRLSPLLPITQFMNGQYSWAGVLMGFIALEYPRTTAGFNLFLDNALFQSSGNDLIVGFNSQQGGLAPPYTGNTTGQMHIASGGNSAVQARFEALLRENSRSTAVTNSFTTAGFQPRPITSIFPRLAAPLAAKITATLHITSPTRSQVFTNPDSISVAVSASSNVTRIMLVCGTGTGNAELTTKLITGAGGTAYIKVPKHGLGRLKLTAFAFADSTYVQYDTLGTRLITSATLQGIRLEPRFAYTSQGDSTLVQVIGSYSDGIDRNVLGQPGMLFSFPGGGKARMGGRNGYVVGLAPGRDSLRVTYAGRTDGVPLVVAPPLATPLATHPAVSQQLAMWPNPAQQAVQVSGAANCPVEVLDMLGRVVRRYAPAGQSDIVTLDLRGLAPGMYLLRAGAATRRLLLE